MDFQSIVVEHHCICCTQFNCKKRIYLGSSQNTGLTAQISAEICKIKEKMFFTSV